MAAMAAGARQCLVASLTYECCFSSETCERQSKRASIWAKMVGMSRIGSRYGGAAGVADMRVGVMS